MKSRRSSTDPKLPIAGRRVRHRKREQVATDQEKWLFPADTTPLEVALPNELITEIDDVLDVLSPALRDRADFVYEACRYAIESWKEGIATAEGNKLLVLARAAKRRAARKRARTRDHK